MNEPFLHFAVNRTVSGEQKKYRESIRGRRTNLNRSRLNIKSDFRASRDSTVYNPMSKKKKKIESEELSMIKKSMVDIFLD